MSKDRKPKVAQGDEPAVKAAVEVADGKGVQTPQDQVTLRNGVILRVTPMPSLLIRQAVSNVPVPEVPKVHIEDEDRWEENPSDPDYIAASRTYQLNTAMAGINISLLMATSPDLIPGDVMKPHDEDWKDTMRVLSLGNPESRAERYLSWIKYILSDNDQLALVTQAIAAHSGVSEEEVAAAVAEFRDPPIGGDTDGLPTEKDSE